MSRLLVPLALLIASPLLAGDEPTLCSAKRVRIEVRGVGNMRSSVENAVSPWWKVVSRRADADAVLLISPREQWALDGEYRDLKTGNSRTFSTAKFHSFSLASSDLARLLTEELKGCDPDPASGSLFGEIPAEAQAHLDRAVVHHQKGEYAAAVSEWKHYLRFQPENSYGHANLGVTLLAMKDWSGAAKAFERSVQLNRHNDIALYNLGFAYWKLGKMDRSRARLQDVLKINPEHEQALRLLALLDAS